MTKEIKKVMNLDNPIPEDSLNGYLFSNENKGHKFIISCTKGGELQTLTGSVTVRFMRANNTTILLGQGGSDGRENYAQIVDGNAEVTLHPDCYNVPGRFKISVFNISGDTVSCIYVGVGTVSRTQNGELIDSGDIVPSIDELVGYIDDCIAATENAEEAADHAVRYDVAQTLTDPQKAQARTNIDASSRSDVDDLKSAITQKTRNIVEGVLINCSIESNGLVKANQQNYDLWYAPVENGEKYTISTNDTLNKIVCGYFSNIPAIGDIASSGRVIQDSITVTAPLNGYIIFRVMHGYEYAQIEEGETKTDYIPPITATDFEARDEIQKNAYELEIAYKTAKAGNYTSFADYIEPGTYGFSSDKYDSIIDAPEDSVHMIYNLYVFPNSWAGEFTLQRLQCYDGKIWERTLVTETKAVLFDWHRVDAEYVFSQQVTGNCLKGKKLVTAGDSYTAAVFTGDYAEYNGKNFGYYIAQRNAMTFVNSGINGSTMAVPSASGAGERSPFSVQRYLDVPADTDYLTIWFGINDSAYCTLGTIDDTENTTFYGAWNKVLEYYLTNRPWMKILIIVTTIGVGDAENAEAFKQAVRNVATKWGYPILDWNKESNIPAFFEKEGMSSTAQALRKNAFGWNGPVNGHPNPQWHEYESTIIENALRSI